MDELIETVLEITAKVQNRTGYRFSIAELYEILTCTIRKVELTGKSQNYIPILFENELEDHISRKAINALWRGNQCVISA